MKKTILHFIYDLGRGGAETMLVQVLKNLKEYNNIVVTMDPLHHFEDELECTKFICLRQSPFLFPVTAFRLRRIIKQYNVDIVHTHLFWPTLIARMGVPKNVQLITTIHAFIATSVEYKKWYIRFLDKSSYRLRRSVIIGVAKGATREYFSYLNIIPYRSYTVYTFVDLEKFNITHIPGAINNAPFRLISIGALRVQKNHKYLVEAFGLLREKNIELDIFGRGPLHAALQKAIDETGAKVTLKGQMEKLNEILPGYDLCVMSSTFEGFSLGVLETMASKVPMLLSDIVSFREQCEDTAIYFNLKDVSDFVLKVNSLAADPQLRLRLGEQAYLRVIKNFTLKHHMDQLKSIYVDVLKTE
ncbi:MAG: glycosyltransferase [Ferruginibacter sp.]